MDIVGKRYAIAVFHEVDSNQRKVIEKDFNFIQKTFASSRELTSIIASPVIKPFQKASILKTLFEEKVSEMTMRIIKTMVDKNRAGSIVPMIKEFHGLIDEEASVVDAYVTTAIEMGNDEKELLSKKLQDIFNKKPRLNCREDKSIIGGFYVRVGDSVIDESLQNKLKVLKKQLQAER